MSSFKEILKKNIENPRPRAADDYFWKQFQIFRMQVVDKLLPRQLEELATLTESEQDECIDIISEKLMSMQKMVPPSWRYMVYCEKCEDFRPIPKKMSRVKTCGWCSVLHKGEVK